MRITLLLFSAAMLWGCSGGTSVVTDCYSSSRFRMFSTPSFSLSVMNVRSQDRSRVDLYIQMPYTHLRFEKDDDLFRASYTMVFVLRDSLGNVVTTRETDHPINARTYEESVSARFDVHFQSFSLLPGQYTAEITAVDNLSRLRYRMQQHITAEDYSGTKVAASTVLLIETMSRDGSGIALRPVLPSAVSMLDDSIGMFQEFYGVLPGDTVTVSDEFIHHTVPAEDEERSVFMMPPYSLTTAECGREDDSVTFRSDTLLTAVASPIRYLVRFHPLPPPGAADLRRRLIIRRNGVNDTLMFVHSIFRRDRRLRTALSMDEVTFVLRFLMRGEEYDSLMAASGARRAARITEFWEPRGGTARRAEFERRIREANTLFTACVDGSRTAMGIMYAICGIPDYIDCRGSSFETWYYTIGERSFPVQFRKRNATDRSFTLLPYAVNESFWQYVVDRWRKRQ